MSEKDLESISSDFSRLNVSDSAECLLLEEVREMLTQEWIAFLADNKRGKSLTRIRAGAPAAGELFRLVRDMQQKMSGDKYHKMQTFIREFRDLPGVTSMEDTLIKLSVHLETAPPETGEVRNYSKRVLWLETFSHISGTLVGQMDVILSFLKGREPRELLKKTKDLLASTSLHSIQSRSSMNSAGKSVDDSSYLPEYCTIS